MKLKSTQHEYEFEHPNGYRFHVTASYDPEFGWAAAVSIHSYGMRDVEAAIGALHRSATEFVKQAAEYAERDVK